MRKKRSKNLLLGGAAIPKMVQNCLRLVGNFQESFSGPRRPDIFLKGEVGVRGPGNEPKNVLSLFSLKYKAVSPWPKSNSIILKWLGGMIPLKNGESKGPELSSNQL